ncbi:MAG: universal stress protein [Nitrosopumilaceae archaeon]
MSKILFPFNDSKIAPHVFGHALTIAKLQGATITVVSIVNKDLARGWVNGTPSRQSSVSLGSVDNLKNGIKKMQALAKKFNVPFDHTIIPSKKVADTILSLIDSQKIDLVVMGTKGNAMWKEMLMGRVSSTVGLNAKCPVLLVK